MEQFKEYVEGVQDRMSSLRREHDRLEEEEATLSHEPAPRDPVEIRAFAECAQAALQRDLKFDEKHAIVMSVVDKVIANREKLRIIGAIPVQPLTNVAFCPSHRHRWDTTRNEKIPFTLTIPLPPPRYARAIVGRDKQGRIRHSVVPPSI